MKKTQKKPVSKKSTKQTAKKKPRRPKDGLAALRKRLRGVKRKRRPLDKPAGRLGKLAVIG